MFIVYLGVVVLVWGFGSESLLFVVFWVYCCAGTC